MRRYAIQRSLTVMPILLGVSLLVFGFIHLIPGDPALTMLGERATPEKVTDLRDLLGRRALEIGRASCRERVLCVV